MIAHASYAFTLCVVCGLLPREHYRSTDYGTYGYVGDEFHNFTAPNGYVMDGAPRQLGPEPAFVYGEPLSANDAKVIAQMRETRESLMAEADARLGAARTRGRETMDALLPHPPVKAKRSRRNKAQMAAHRAEVASRGQSSVPQWLQDADAEADAEFQRVTGDV